MRLFTDLFKNKEIRMRIIFTLAMLLIYRLGTVIPVPNVDSVKLGAMVNSIKADNAVSTLVGMMNILGGGLLQSLSIFSLGVSPYITASIIIQLLSMDVIPYLTELTKSGQKGKQQLDRITRYLGVVLGYVQSIGILYVFNMQYDILLSAKPIDYFFMGTVITAGTMFVLWLADQITAKGIGNGTSLIIFSGIVASLPGQFTTTFQTMVTAEGASTLGWLWFTLYAISYFAIIVLVVYMNGAVRKISIQYTSSAGGSVRGKGMNHLPLMINSASVIPVIFAGAIMQAPIIAMSWISQGSVYKFLSTYMVTSHPIGLVVYAVLIILFTFFYTNLQIDPEKMSEDFAKNNSYIPGVRPGKDTKTYISTILNRITVLGAIFLTFIAVLPHLLPMLTSNAIPASTAPGGTGIIIVVGVALETVKELEGRLTQRNYKGLFSR